MLQIRIRSSDLENRANVCLSVMHLWCFGDASVMLRWWDRAFTIIRTYRSFLYENLFLMESVQLYLETALLSGTAIGFLFCPNLDSEVTQKFWVRTRLLQKSMWYRTSQAELFRNPPKPSWMSCLSCDWRLDRRHYSGIIIEIKTKWTLQRSLFGMFIRGSHRVRTRRVDEFRWISMNFNEFRCHSASTIADLDTLEIFKVFNFKLSSLFDRLSKHSNQESLDQVS